MYIYNLKKNVYNTDDFNRVKLLDENGMLEGSYINASHVLVSQNTLAFFSSKLQWYEHSSIALKYV